MFPCLFKYTVMIPRSFLFSASKIVKHIDDQFQTYLREEMQVKRSLKFCSDNRIHACVYFISPTGHGFCHKNNMNFAQYAVF